MSRQTVDLIVQIPLEEEFVNFLKIFPIKENLRSGVYLSYLVEAPNGAKVVAILQERMGKSAALEACRHILSRFTPSLYVCLGIAGGVSSDLKLGDVVYTGTMIDILDNSKILDSEDGEGLEVDFEPEFYHSNRLLTANVGFIRTMPELEEVHQKWQADCLEHAEALFPDGIPLAESQFETNREPKCQNGTLICGAVGQSDRYKKRLKSVTRKLLALETESGSIFAECIDQKINVIAIRGLSDYADSEKKRLEESSKDDVRCLAATNAARFLKAQLDSDPFIDFIISDDQPLLDLNRGAGAHSNVPELLKRASDAIDEKLRHLSHHYKVKPVGFRLPPPRVRPILADQDQKTQSRPTEILKAIETFSKIVINVPRTYPDPALAWAIAGHLVSADVGGFKVIPIVIDGRAITRPKSGLAALSPIEIPADPESLGCEIVFIIHNFDFNSKSRTDFIASEIDGIKGARYIFVADEDKNISAKLEQRRRITSHEFTVCNASFNEMALFFEDAFSMPGREAEVLALEFQKLFRQFQLPSHPTFFAGIASDVISALLQANRRSELIQLAVDGALSFIVAADTDAVRLSRTTRSSFLRKLVFEQKVNKRTFNQAQLIEFTQSISDQFDYGINPISFIDSFEQNGILYFDDGRARVTLPFIESYLLARELLDNPDQALDYFDPSSDDFDFLAFDLYAELGPDRAIFSKVISSIEFTVSSLTFDGNSHILIGNSISPRILGRPARMVSLRKRVSDARLAIESGKGDRDEKIRLLELAERVQEDVAQRQESPSEDQSNQHDGVEAEDLKILNDLGRAWTVGALLLGSGAESLEGDDRLNLANRMLEISDALMNHWTKLVNDINYEEVKQNIKLDKDIRSTFKNVDELEFESLVDSMVDYIEYVSLADPFDLIAHQLTDVARNGVVGNTLKRISPSTPVQRVMHGAWLTHIDPKAGRRLLLDAIDNLPSVEFFRVILTSWLIVRLKWKVPNEQTQMALLDAAEAAIKPLNRSIEKGELIRLIGKKDNKKSEASDDDLEN